MIENRSLEEVKRGLVSELRDYSTFKRKVALKSALASFALIAFGISFIILIYNAITSFATLLKNDIPMEYFGEMFLDTYGTNIIWYVATMIALILLIPAGLAWLVQRLRSEKSYQRLHESFTANPNIESEMVAKVSEHSVFTFNTEEETRQIAQLAKTEEFANDKKLQKKLRPDLVEKSLGFCTKHFMKIYGIEAKVLHVTSVKSQNLVACNDGDFLLYINDGNKHSINLNK